MTIPSCTYLAFF
uniref:Uncharacterized protein n=1 Tax=Arundo donax TaxID=35708 RepID=A0A0A9CMV0_ARUDO